MHPDKAQCLYLGHWPGAKAKGKGKRPATAWFKHITQAVQALTDAIAPTEGVYSVAIELDTTTSDSDRAVFRRKVGALRITGKSVQVARYTNGVAKRVLKQPYDSKGRQLILSFGVAGGSLPVETRPAMKGMGFSLANVP